MLRTLLLALFAVCLALPVQAATAAGALIPIEMELAGIK
jgi:hypothetical protein